MEGAVAEGMLHDDTSSLENPWLHKSLTVIEDCGLAERSHLFQQSRILKEALLRNDQEVTDSFRINDPDFGVYSVFLEDSTRTKESFRNAASFHRVRLNDLVVSQSSLNKSESFSDTFHNLIGYDNQIFIVRSWQEGLCRWLLKSSTEYVRRMGFGFLPSFINAGDGAHEHPTQELLDGFTFLEDLGWDYDHIHISLIGDLLHGRTVHSKVNGLKIFRRVEVDLIAPSIMGMPLNYIRTMEDLGYQVRCFDTIDKYLAQGHIAPMWYFTRLQLERMDETIRRQEADLRYSVTLRQEHLRMIPAETKMYHPLPRHKKWPVIPRFVDDTSFNAWERQSANGRIVRIALLALIAGRRPQWVGTERRDAVQDLDLYTEVPIRQQKGKTFSEGVRPIRNGIVIDHILRGESPAVIRRHMHLITKIMGLENFRGGEWVGRGSKTLENGENEPAYKGIIFVPNAQPFSAEEMRKLAVIAPHATVNYIEEGTIHHKYRLQRPLEIRGFTETMCRNQNCISHISHDESVDPEFTYNFQGKFLCIYCHTGHDFQELWYV